MPAIQTAKTKSGYDIAVISWDFRSFMDPDDVIFHVRGMKVATVRTDPPSSKFVSGGPAISSIQALGAIPDDAEVLIHLSDIQLTEPEPGAPSTELERYEESMSEKEARPSTGELLSAIADVSEEHLPVYDSLGVIDAVLPARAFEQDCTPSRRYAPPKRYVSLMDWDVGMKFVGNLDDCACDEDRAEHIRQATEALACQIFVRSILGDVRHGLKPSNAYSYMKDMFASLSAGHISLPIDEESCTRAMSALEAGSLSTDRSETFLSVFFTPEALGKERYEKSIDRMKEAIDLLESAFSIWMDRLTSFGTPLTIQDWTVHRSQAGDWNIENMKVLAELIGAEPYLRALAKGIPVDSLLPANKRVK